MTNKRVIPIKNSLLKMEEIASRLTASSTISNNHSNNSTLMKGQESLCEDCVFRGSCSIADSLSRKSVPLRSIANTDPFQLLVTKLVTTCSKDNKPNKKTKARVTDCSFYSSSSTSFASSSSCTSYYSCCNNSNNSTWFHPDSLKVKLCQENCPFHLQKSFGYSPFSFSFIRTLSFHSFFSSIMTDLVLPFYSLILQGRILHKKSRVGI
jgi:hypothetical protein